MRQSEDGIEQLYDGLITPVNDVFMINPETRIIEVPETERLFGVNFDKDVEKKYFKCPKIVGNNIDLSKHKIYVVYQKADENVTTVMGEVGKYWCEDAKVDETGDYIEFSWLLSGNVLEELATYYPVTNISVNSEQLDGYTVFNYPISMANGWNYVKQQLNDNRDYIYDMDVQSAEAYVNSEYAGALTELEV